MKLLLSMPGGSEWILIIIFFGLFLVMPILAVLFYVKNRKLTKELERVNNEKDTLLAKVMGKTT